MDPSSYDFLEKLTDHGLWISETSTHPEKVGIQESGLHMCMKIHWYAVCRSHIA